MLSCSLNGITTGYQASQPEKQEEGGGEERGLPAGAPVAAAARQSPPPCPQCSPHHAPHGIRVTNKSIATRYSHPFSFFLSLPHILAHHRHSPSRCAALAEGVTAGLCLGDKGGEAEHEKRIKEGGASW